MDWQYALYPNKRVLASFCNENAHLWFDGFGELAGFAVSESGDGGFSILTLDGYRFPYKETCFTHRFDLTGELVPRYPLEPGFQIVDMEAHPNFRAQSIIRANAFQKKDNLTEEELDERIKYFNYSMRGPVYHPYTDLCVAAKDGRFVSDCEALINAPCLEADIERVCNHSDFRKRGFARAVIQECLYR